MGTKENGHKTTTDVSHERDGVLKGRNGFNHNDPVNRALGDIRYIRDLIDASHDFFVSGWSGVVAGIISTIGVIITAWIIAHPGRWDLAATLWTFWIVIGILLLASDIFFFVKRSREVGRPIFSPLLVKLGFTEFLMGAQGFILTVLFIKIGAPEYIPGVWLVTFGVTLTALGLFIPGGLWILGLSSLVAGVAALVVPSGGLWCAGFAGMATCIWGAGYLVMRGK